MNIKIYWVARYWTVLLMTGMMFVCLSAQAGPKSDFILWQLPPQTNIQMNSYVLKMANGKLVVLDGGTKGDTHYLRGFLAALGNEVEAWFISHPHLDHMQALEEILKAPGGIKIKAIYHHRLSEPYYGRHELEYKEMTKGFYNQLDRFGGKVVDITQPGFELRISNTFFKVLTGKSEEITINPYNNQSMVLKVWDRKKSVLFLGDLGREGGDKLMAGPFRKDLDCDYLQMAHHGQTGVSKDFYRSITFKACLWPTPQWLYDNNAGKGYNTHKWETVEIRNLMEELGIKQHFIAFKGISKIE